VDVPAGSVSRWICGLKAGDPRALQPLWNRYYAMLVERASAKLRGLHHSPAFADADDLASSAFQALYEGIRAGRFPQLEDRDDLWRLFIHLTACKALDRHRAETRQKRGAGKVFSEAEMTSARADDEDEARSLDQIIGAEPSPEFAAMVAEDYCRRLDALPDESLRRIAELKAACYTNEEIRRQLGCSLRTVTLKLELIRKTWRMDQVAS
jgi:DNA-directed RNA polymerase specialized sigma24 family protein